MLDYFLQHFVTWRAMRTRVRAICRTHASVTRVMRVSCHGQSLQKFRILCKVRTHKYETHLRQYARAETSHAFFPPLADVLMLTDSSVFLRRIDTEGEIHCILTDLP